MRENLKELIKETIVFKYELPSLNASISKTKLTSDKDQCFESICSEKFSDVIYNSIIEYSFNEFDLDKNQYKNLHSIALKNKLKYNPDAKESTKIKYGFLGEVILYSILFLSFKSDPIIARGYFYNPLENSETKGYDSYHLIEHDNSAELWFGEVKFHSSYKSGINSVLKNLEKAISDDYLEQNLLAIQNFRSNLNLKNTKIEKIIDDWEKNPELKISEELKQHNLKLVYPIMLLYDKKANKDYNENIKVIPEYIDSIDLPNRFNISIEYSIFFILIPLLETKKIKQNVIKWIESKKSLLS